MQDNQMKRSKGCGAMAGRRGMGRTLQIAAAAMCSILMAVAPGLPAAADGPPGGTPAPTDREMQGLVGPVQIARSETAPLTSRSGQVAEGAKRLVWVATYDAAGHTLEYDFHNSDAAGNWTRRTTARQVVKFGKTELEPVEVTYQTLTYFPSATP